MEMIQYNSIEPIFNDGTLLSWSNLTVLSVKTNTHLINNLNGYIKNGFCAIMGQSGSGKTTFLSALSKRISNNMKLYGNTYINNKEYTKRDLKNLSGYVMSDDILHAELTVYETLFYNAELKTPRNTKKEEILIKIEEILKYMDLHDCRDTMVGDFWNQGISTGEKKRLCVAIELITEPKILFLDEPTSGLDSKSALILIEKLKQITNDGCMVVCSIHQPQNKIFKLFDNLILMNNGNIVYNGPIIHLIESISYKYSNTTDENNISYGDILLEECINNDTSFLMKNNNLLDIDISSYNNSSIFKNKDKQTWIKQFEILFRRNMMCQFRNWKILLVNISCNIIVSFFTCTSVWYNIGTNKKSVSLRQAALFFCIIHQGFVASLQGTHTFPLERNIMIRERKVGTYYLSSYYISKIVSDFLIQIIHPIIFTSIVYYNIGFQPSIDKFFIFMGFMILSSMSATSISNMVSCICIRIDLSTIVLAAIYEISRLYGGWFISPKLLISYENWRFADALSYLKYSFIGISLNENNNLLITCSPSELSKDNKCVIPPLNVPPYTGEAFKEYYGYNDYTINYCAGILIVYIFMARLIGYLALKYNNPFISYDFSHLRC
jgi:ABC-type multidrug transport system ATPase subunit